MLPAPWSHAVIGTALWGLFALLQPMATWPFVVLILALGPLVIVPIGLWLAPTVNRDGTEPHLYRLARRAQLVAAPLVLCSFYTPHGKLAAALASPWLFTTCLIGLYGLSRLLPRAYTPPEEAAVDAGLLFLPVGGVWLFLHRLGSQPLGFDDLIVLLTAVHFHYAGFAAPIIAGMAGRSGRLSAWVSGALIIGTPLVALGIARVRIFEPIGAMILTAGLLGVSITSMRLLRSRAMPRWVWGLLLVSAVSPFASMALACLWALSRVAGTAWISMEQMIWWHGTLNAFGFSLAGLVAYAWLKPGERVPPPGLPFSRLASHGKVGPSFFDRMNVIEAGGRAPSGLVDDLRTYGRPDFDPDAVHPAIRAFYEQTNQHDLVVRSRWYTGFRWGGRLWGRFGSWIGQLNLPVSAGAAGEPIDSAILPLVDALDGRHNVRAWVRTYRRTGKAVYVAAYSTHTWNGDTYMNIAFPLPWSNLSSILRLEAHSMPGESLTGVLLTTFANPGAPGDQGVYLATRLLPVRLPMNETIRVWPVQEAQSSVTLKARHDIWFCGIKALSLDYDIFPLA